MDINRALARNEPICRYFYPHTTTPTTPLVITSYLTTKNTSRELSTIESMTSKSLPTRTTLSSGTFYQIYPPSFADSNKDGIGDFRGIISRLDYLSDLGITGIWLNACFDSPFKDGGYDVRDYTKVASRYGTHEDLVELFHQAHARGIAIILDLVPGHTSEQHPWFQQSAASKYTDFDDRYIWTSHAFEGGAGLAFIGGEHPRNGAYIINFFKSQPALNYGFAELTQPWHQPVDAPGPRANQDAMVEIMKYWLSQGADGFRVDMADSLVKNDGTSKRATIGIWQSMLSQVRAEFPNAIFVSEWGTPTQAFEAGFDADFYLDWRGNGYNLLARNTDTPLERRDDASFFNSDSATGAQEFLDMYLPQWERTHEAGLFSFISGNHDCPRLAPRLNEQERALFFLFQLTMPGLPFIYYGDEIGLPYAEIPTKEGGYARTGSRTPMCWDSQLPNGGFSLGDAPLYLPMTDTSQNVAQQRERADSLFHHVQKLIQLRSQLPALDGFADLEFDLSLLKKHPKVMVYRRTHHHCDSVLIALNAGNKPIRVELQQPQAHELFRCGDVTYPDLSDHSVVELGPTSGVILSV
ncbi:alpha-amylase family glycosyl hydrolase [Corynebacterium diphtheriae bv. gravis]|uniref:alpha-amylase family glycosyl hydrolase n=1 Tax=Corynebacterium diphtheriae TaxID=1717 RepID=UPI00217DEA77|nr:alpha-amylase family glycosyl hydrolase [Corynebacterium diphtheriae]UWE82014.1 alpha-amylase family glycosyl hydrolase [Corynebacterium diphtheriae bv. gravis]UWF07519.1 alpha-amylase family glycosyl hydrolase [Corynebacterium diphtheriae bv. gravis]